MGPFQKRGQEGLETFLREAKKLLEAKKYPALVVLCDRSLGRDRNHAEAHAFRAFARQELGDLEGALEDCSEALGHDPSYLTCYRERGLILLRLHREEEAGRDFERYLTHRPDQREAVEALIRETRQQAAPPSTSAGRSPSVGLRAGVPAPQSTDRTTLTVLAVGNPAPLRPPKPLPGETTIQMVIRGHPHQWQVCVENLVADHGVSATARERLLRGHIDGLGPSAQREVERFVNICLPTHFRTLQGLARLRDGLKERNSTFEIVEVLALRECHPGGDLSHETMAAGLGVKVISFPTGAPRALDLSALLPSLAGDFVWLVPGGTRLPGQVQDRLERALRYLGASPRRAVYSDQHASFLYRTAALRELAGRVEALPADVAEMGRLLRGAGYEVSGDDDPERVLCELEIEYGGWSRNPTLHPHRDEAKRPWWSRWLGR